jgi:hypothetical protein
MHRSTAYSAVNCADKLRVLGFDGCCVASFGGGLKTTEERADAGDHATVFQTLSLSALVALPL